MSRNNNRWRSCKIKKYYPTEETAVIIRNFRALDAPSWKDVVAYKCEYCDGWHLGHMPKKDDKLVPVNLDGWQSG